MIDLALATDPFGHDAPVMPAEFSVASYRFGHATAQSAYKLKKGDTDLAIQDLEQAVSSRSVEDNSLMLFHLAQAYLEDGNPAEAKRALQRAFDQGLLVKIERFHLARVGQHRVVQGDLFGVIKPLNRLQPESLL